MVVSHNVLIDHFLPEIIHIEAFQNLQTTFVFDYGQLISILIPGGSIDACEILGVEWSCGGNAPGCLVTHN